MTPSSPAPARRSPDGRLRQLPLELGDDLLPFGRAEPVPDLQSHDERPQAMTVRFVELEDGSLGLFERKVRRRTGEAARQIDARTPGRLRLLLLAHPQVLRAERQIDGADRLEERRDDQDRVRGLHAFGTAVPFTAGAPLASPAEEGVAHLHELLFGVDHVPMEDLARPIRNVDPRARRS
ncbi:hypothetical protein H4W80_003326 [Nonomuraea angiospora]|uniref:Uncharacterized protein n=1 Tax=Nonomuraea angiospora TaxID=46172 RepID=A0ABR9LWP0_9ACTN|nr:hypothetical protein [Nonomuraea angiospora]MBE1585068.1 hypothetical protein [Nonomuraea angiospora]